MPSTLTDQEISDGPKNQNPLADDARWHLVQRIISSTTFNKATRLNNFLSYVCERKLLGRDDEITEHQIGIHVFGRPTDYNPGEDNIVRTSARLLRQRLTQYFHEEGGFEPEIIVIPRGGYVPVFETRPLRITSPAESSTTEAQQALSVAQAAETTRPVVRPWMWAVIGSTALLLLVAFVIPGLSRSPADRLWDTIFSRGGSTLLVVSDSGLVMLENMTHHAVNVSAYSGGNYYIDIDGQDSSASNDLIRNLGKRRYTSIDDLKLASSFSALGKSKDNTLDVKYARDITTDNLKRGNLILSGDPQGNPWVELFEKDLNFRFSMDDTSAIHIVRNMRPLPGEQAEYRSFADDPQHHAYALIALTRSLDGQGHVLLIEGTTMAGLEAAQDFLFLNSDLSRVLRPAVKRDGIHDFEVLLESKNIAAKASGFQVIGTRVH